MLNRIGFSNQPISTPQPAFKGEIKINNIDEAFKTAVNVHSDLQCLQTAGKRGEMGNKALKGALNTLKEKLDAGIEYLTGKGKSEITPDKKEMADAVLEINTEHSAKIAELLDKMA